MRRFFSTRGFSLAETMIAMSASVMIVGALFAGSAALQRTCASADRYVTDQSNERLLLDYLARDLRRAIGLASSTGGLAAVKLGAGSVTIESQADLAVTLPAYYKSNAPADADFDQPLPVIASGDRVAYGDAAGPAPNITVTFRKLFVAAEGCVCFVRTEAAAQLVIVRKADDLHIRVTVANDGKSCAIEGWFESPFSSARPRVAAFDRVMLRNLRVD